jgi:diguanylate cyclase (GGDEF)-like protein/PAS domain S-box-containing protein
MHSAFLSISLGKSVTTQSYLSSVNERLSLALASARQIAFDWSIPDDRLYFSGEVNNVLKQILLDTSQLWSSRTLPAIMHPEDQTTFRAHLHAALKEDGDSDGSFHQVELRLKDAVKSWRWVAISGRIVERDASGRALRMVGAFSDIDERKQTEKKFARLRDLYAALSQTNQAIVRISERDSLFQEICRIAVEHGRFRMAWIGLINAHNQQVAPAAAHGERLDILRDVVVSIDGSKPESRGVIGTALRDNTPAFCNSFSSASSPQYCHEAVVHTGFGSVGSFPFQLDGKALGSLNLYAEETDFFDSELIILLQEMTADISFAIENYRRESHRKSMEAALVDSAMRYRQMIEMSPEGILVCREGKLALLNQAGCRLLGAKEPSQLLGRSIFDFVGPEFHDLLADHLQMQESDASSSAFTEQKWLRVDGSRFDAETATSGLMYNQAPAVQVVIHDISERKRSESLQLGQNRILNMIATGAELRTILAEIACFIEGQTEHGLCSILQLHPDGKTLTGRVAPSLPQSYLDASGIAEAGPANGSGGTAVHRAEPVIVTDIANDPLWKSRKEVTLRHGLKACSSWPIFGRNRKILGSFSLYFGDTIAPTAREMQLLSICSHLAGIAIESRASEERIRYLAHYDGLTSLPNRFLFKEYLELALRNAQRHHNKFAVFFLDLDKFKEVNDTFGHDAGDQVLCEIATRLRQCLRHTDKIARMGGDEFYVLIEELHDSRDAADVAQKLLEAASRPVLAGGVEHRLSVSIGIGIYPDDGRDGQALLKNADAAMYRAKEAGKNGFEFYAPESRAFTSERKHPEKQASLHIN